MADTTEYGALTVTEGRRDYDLDLRWADNRLGLGYEDVESLRAITEREGNLKKSDDEYLASLADRIEGVLP